MGNVMEAVGHYWWLIFVFGGSIGGAVKSVAVWNERRAQRRQERYLARQKAKAAQAQLRGQDRQDAQARRQELRALQRTHREVDERWFAYETNLATLLDYPMMTDMREPLTVDFHKARRRADLARPLDLETGEDAEQADEIALEVYRDAVHDYATAFDVAEAEAKRRRRGDFSPIEQERLSKAQRLLSVAADSGATTAERRAAYERARKELDGLLDIPAPAAQALERGIAGELER
jgi:hypothetical protein